MLIEFQTHVFAGSPDAGKSMLMIQQVVSWHRKTPYLIPELSFAAFKRIAWIVGDRTGEAGRRFRANDLPTTGPIHLYDTIADETFHKSWYGSELGFYHALDRLPKDGIPFDFIFLDPLPPFLPGLTNVYKDMMHGLIDIGRYAAKHKVTILASAHAGKARSDFNFKRPQDSISGSNAIAGYSGTQAILRAAEEIDQPYSEVTVVSHEGPPASYKLTRRPDGYFIPWIEPPIERKKKSDFSY
jgi:hypothetical protein